MNTRRWLWLVFPCLLPVVLFLAGCSDQPGEANTVGVNDQPLLIEPNIGVGPIRTGMTTQQVISVIGEPARRTANRLDYPKLGLAVLPGQDGIVQVVMCGDVTGLQGPFVKAFHGKTAQGIGMESSREDLLKAFGEPTTAETFRGGQESMTYANQGITFTLERGKVHHMIVRLDGPHGGGRDTNVVPVDLAPPSRSQ